jgi:hypothetical protein
MNSTQFKSRLSMMRAGEKLAYFTGCLAFSRHFSQEVENLANAVWQAAGMKWVPNGRPPTARNGNTGQWQSTGERRVVLTQRRLSEPLGCEYIATKL